MYPGIGIVDSYAGFAPDDRDLLAVTRGVADFATHAKAALELDAYANVIVGPYNGVSLRAQADYFFLEHVLDQIELRAGEIVKRAALTRRQPMRRHRVPRLDVNEQGKVGALQSADSRARAKLTQVLVGRPESTVEVRHQEAMCLRWTRNLLELAGQSERLLDNGRHSAVRSVVPEVEMRRGRRRDEYRVEMLAGKEVMIVVVDARARKSRRSRIAGSWERVGDRDDFHSWKLAKRGDVVAPRKSAKSHDRRFCARQPLSHEPVRFAAASTRRERYMATPTTRLKREYR